MEGPREGRSEASSDLRITKLSHYSAPVTGGTEIIALCDHVPKDDIEIWFLEEQGPMILWEEKATFKPSDVHKQVAICFKTPRYHNQNIKSSVPVSIVLKQPSIHKYGEKRHFEFSPIEKDPEGLSLPFQSLAKAKNLKGILDSLAVQDPEGLPQMQAEAENSNRYFQEVHDFSAAQGYHCVINVSRTTGQPFCKWIEYASPSDPEGLPQRQANAENSNKYFQEGFHDFSAVQGYPSVTEPNDPYPERSASFLYSPLVASPHLAAIYSSTADAREEYFHQEYATLILPSSEMQQSPEFLKSETDDPEEKTLDEILNSLELMRDEEIMIQNSSTDLSDNTSSMTDPEEKTLSEILNSLERVSVEGIVIQNSSHSLSDNALSMTDITQKDISSVNYQQQ